MARQGSIPEGVREVLGLPTVLGGPLPGVPRPARRSTSRSLFPEEVHHRCPRACRAYLRDRLCGHSAVSFSGDLFPWLRGTLFGALLLHRVQSAPALADDSGQLNSCA